MPKFNFVPKNLYYNIPVVDIADMRFPESMRKRVSEALTAAFTIAQNRTQFARNREGRERGFSYHNKGFSLEGIGGTFFLGHIVYSYLQCPYDGLTIYNLLPSPRNEILIHPTTKRAVPRRLATVDLIRDLNPITSSYNEEQANYFIRLMQLPAYEESNFAKHDHQAVLECLNGIANLPILMGEEEPVILYNTLAFFVRMAMRLWFGNGRTLEFIRDREEHLPDDIADGIYLDYEQIDLVDLAMCDENHPIEGACATAFRHWLSSSAQLELTKALSEFSKLPYTGEITFVGQTIPDEFFQKFTTAIIDQIISIVKYAAIFHSQGVTFFREYPRVSRIMKSMHLDPKLASAIGRTVDPAFFFGWYSGITDLTPSVVQDYLDEFLSKHNDILLLWKEFLATHYHSPDENIVFAPVVTGLYAVNSFGQKEIYSYAVVAPYDKMATRINIYPEGESVVDDMYSSLQDNATRFNKTERVVEALRPPEGHRYNIDQESWDFNPQLLDLMRRSLWELELNYVNDKYESVELRYHQYAFLIIPKLNIELPFVINVFDGYARLPYAWSKVPVPVASLDIPQLAFAFTREEASQVDNTGEDEVLTKLYLERLDRLAAGKVIGRRMITILPELTKAARFAWNAYIATAFPMTADKCLQKIRVSANYETLNRATRVREFTEGDIAIQIAEHNATVQRTAAVMVFPREIEVAYPVNLNELDSRDRNAAVRNFSRNYRRDGIIYYSGSGRGARVLTRNRFASFMEDYVVGVTRLRFEEEYFAGLGKFIDTNNPDNLTISFTSPFFEADPRVTAGLILGDGCEEDFYDPYGPEKTPIMCSFMALSGIIYHLASNSYTSFFGANHGINYYAAQNLIDIVRFWMTLNENGSPSESDGILVRGHFSNIIHSFQSCFNTACELVGRFSTLDPEFRVPTYERPGLIEALRNSYHLSDVKYDNEGVLPEVDNIDLLARFQRELFEAVASIVNTNENVFFSRAGFLHVPLYFGDLFRLLNDKRYGYVRGLSLKTKPIEFNVTSLPSMRDSGCTRSLKAIVNSFANTHFENLIRYLGA